MRRLGQIALAAIAAAVATGASASPKGYDIERFLEEGLPGWRTGAEPAPPPAPIARPLDRLPNVPSPAVLPDPGPEPGPEPGEAPAAATIDPPPAPTQYAPMTDERPQRVINAPGSPRSTVAGAWAAPR